MAEKISEKEAYHELINEEASKYNKEQSFSNAFLTEKDIEQLSISEDVFENLINEGFLIKLEEDKYRTLHMDIAFRASDIRVKHGSSKYIVENNLTVKEKPLLRHDYVSFEEGDERFEKLYSSVQEKIQNEEITGAFFESLKEHGVEGLSKYQYKSIMEALSSDNDAVISAPTGFGKTYVFLIPALIEAIQDLRDGIGGTKAVFFYPRNALGSDQLNRLINLLHGLNKRLDKNLRIGIDIGRKSLPSEGEEFFGAKCPEHGEDLEVKNGRVHCPKRHYLEFVEPKTKRTWDEFESNPPDLLISNIWAWQYRFTKRKLWESNYLGGNVKYFVFDEVHGYRGIVAGVLKYFIKILQELVSPSARVFLSSATIPEPKKFSERILSKKMDDILKLKYNPDLHGVDDKKLELYFLVGVNPHLSWETYIHELAIYLSTISRLREKRETENGLQSLIFIDSIKNINRLYSQSHQAIDLGDPQDHLNEDIPPSDPYSYWIYNKDFKFKKSEIPSEPIDRLKEEIWENIERHYSYKTGSYDVEDDIREGNIDIVYSTSTLELGVDYDAASVVVNAGIPFSLESIPQRVGRAGRKTETSLDTSLSIITVRNNPLEYFYLYEGISNLTDIDKMPAIPVSSDNHFVILYSALLYISALMTKEGRRLGGSIEDVSEVLEYLDKNKTKILDTLDAESDIKRVEEDVSELVNIIDEEKMDETCRDVENYFNRTWLDKTFKDIFEDSDALLDSVQEKIDDVPKRDRGDVKKKIRGLTQLLEEVKRKNLEDTEKILLNLSDELGELKSILRPPSHPLFGIRSEIVELNSKIEKCVGRIRDLKEVSTSLERFRRKGNLYSRACEVYRDTQNATRIIQVLESLIGFKYMGNEFMDKEVTVDAEYNINSKDESLSNLVTRVPPFEMQNVPFQTREGKEITELVGGRYAWLIEPRNKNYYILSENMDSKMVWKSLDQSGLGKGKSTKREDLLIPEEIRFLDFLGQEPFTIKIFGEGTKSGKKPLYLHYGSSRLVNSKVIRDYTVKQEIQQLGTRKKDDLFSHIKNSTIEKLNEINENLKNKGNRWGASLDYISVCRMGQALSTDPFSFRCPKEVREDCGLQCDGEKYWRRSRKMFPKVYLNKKVRMPPSVSSEPPLFLDYRATTYDELVENIEFAYDSAQLNIPAGNVYFQREIKLEPLGYEAKTSFLTFEINDHFLDFTIERILEQKPEIVDLLKYKYYMYQRFLEEGHTAEVAPYVLKYEPEDVDPSSSSFRDYLRKSMIHTLAHLLYIHIATKVGIDPSNITIHIEGSKILLLENSKKDGMGIVETIQSKLHEKGVKAIFENFVTEMSDFLEDHGKRINEREKEIRKENTSDLKRIKKQNEKISNFQEEMNSLNEEIRNHVDPEFLDYSTYRYLLLNQLDIDRETSEFLLTLTNAQGFPHLCKDGCNDCIILKNYCNEPFGQGYLLSRALVQEFFNLIKSGSVSLVRRGVGEKIEGLMKDSKKMIIKSPFIDDFGLNLLNEMQSMGKEIVLITRKENKDLIEKLKDEIEVRFAEDFHDKIYYLKGAGDQMNILINGSVNLQRKGFKENEENISVNWDPTQIESFLQNVEEF